MSGRGGHLGTDLLGSASSQSSQPDFPQAQAVPWRRLLTAVRSGSGSRLWPASPGWLIPVLGPSPGKPSETSVMVIKLVAKAPCDLCDLPPPLATVGWCPPAGSSRSLWHLRSLHSRACPLTVSPRDPDLQEDENGTFISSF
ncbi:hypothetical protein H1C71_012207, partial [Ictidomys tridecemlineatus]